MNNQERLERIKERFSKTLMILGRQNGKELFGDDVEFLLQQAERVEELEKENEFLDKAQKTNIKIAEDAQKENKRYRQALEFYADEDNYELKIDSSKSEPFSPHYYKWVERDYGKKAREALEGDQK